MSDETMSMLDDRIAELEDENAALQRENAALRADASAMSENHRKGYVESRKRIDALERENAALKEKLFKGAPEDYWQLVQKLELLRCENAALRSALTTLIAWEDNGGDIPPSAARGLFRIARAALDAARKEAQP